VSALPILALVSSVLPPLGAAEPTLAARAARFPALATATAAFTQEREVSLVDDVLRSTGTIALRAPDTVRLEVDSPEKLALVAQGSTLSVIEADGRARPLPAEHAALGRFARQLLDLLFKGEAPGAFDQHWEGADAVTLEASDPTAPYDEIRMRFPADGPLPDEIVLRERGGDRTTIHLQKKALNPPLPEAWPLAHANPGSTS
jgi:outer membrane lipoprotein-sorting protein